MAEATTFDELYAGLHDKLAPKPPAEPAALAAARRALDRLRDADASPEVVHGTAAQLIRQADDQADKEAILWLAHEVTGTQPGDDIHQVQIDRQVAAALAAEPAEPAAAAQSTDHRPYLGDDGRLRASDGRVLDTADAVEALRTLAQSDHNAANELAQSVDGATWNALQAAAAESTEPTRSTS